MMRSMRGDSGHECTSNPRTLEQLVCSAACAKRFAFPPGFRPEAGAKWSIE